MFGMQLPDHAIINVQVTDTPTPSLPAVPALPDWCRVYEGLSDQEIDDVEQIALDRGHWLREAT